MHGYRPPVHPGEDERADEADATGEGDGATSGEADAAEVPASSTVAARWAWWVPLVAAFVAHALAMRNGYALDDDVLILDNPYTRDLDGLGFMLRSSLFVASSDPIVTDYYRPAAALLNWLSWQLFGAWRVGQHGINIALHIGICALLGSLLRGHGVRPSWSAAAVTLFAVHPATVELVAYVGGRQDMLGWLFVLASWRLALHAEAPGRLVALGAAATILGMFSREAVLAAAAVMPLGLLGRGPLRDVFRRPVTAGVGVAIGFGVVAAARASVGVGWSQPNRAVEVTEWVRWCGAIVLRQLENLVAPTDLVVDLVPYLPPVGVALFVLLLGGAALGALLRITRGPRASFRPVDLVGHLGFFALAVVHTPVSLIFGFTSDRYAYPFLLCLTLVLTPVAVVVADRLGPALSESPLRPLIKGLPWALALALLPLTLARVTAWRDEFTLMKRQFEVRPNDPMAQLAEGDRRAAMGDCERALPLCEGYRETFPQGRKADACLGVCYLQLGQPERALAPLRRMVAQRPHRRDARSALFDVLFHLRRYDEVQALLDGLDPFFDDEPDVVRARGELEFLREQGKVPP